MDQAAVQSRKFWNWQGIVGFLGDVLIFALYVLRAKDKTQSVWSDLTNVWIISALVGLTLILGFKSVFRKDSNRVLGAYVVLLNLTLILFGILLLNLGSVGF